MAKVTPNDPDGDRLLTPGEVASLFGVHPLTVTRWAKSGKLNCVRVGNNQRRYRESEARALLGYTEVADES